MQDAFREGKSLDCLDKTVQPGSMFSITLKKSHVWLTNAFSMLNILYGAQQIPSLMNKSLPVSVVIDEFYV